jgi:SAM-dependent methyltransferase
MKENKYDNPQFFDKYGKMQRSVKGLLGAGEWHTLKSMFPDFKGKRVLDLGCGFGWHCAYAAEQGASSVLGIDISEKMLDKAKALTGSYNIEYRCVPIEDYEYPENSFDAVISSLAFHYVKSFDDICARVQRCLTVDGDFVFSVEHPIFTSQGRQDWVYDDAGNPLHWPVDDYFYEGERAARFLDEDVVKYHRTVTAYINGLLRCGFEITGFREPMPTDEMLDMPGMRDELRRPTMLIISAKK